MNMTEVAKLLSKILNKLENGYAGDAYDLLFQNKDSIVKCFGNQYFKDMKTIVLCELGLEKYANC